MTMMHRLPELLALPAEDRLALAEALWSSLSDTPDALPVPDWHLDVVTSRLAGSPVAEDWDTLLKTLKKTGG